MAVAARVQQQAMPVVGIPQWRVRLEIQKAKGDQI
jgi:hypothetical protein